MLQATTNGSIVELGYQGAMASGTLTTTNAMTVGNVQELSNTFGTCYQTWPHTVYWNSYPVYVCTDKTKKAIEVLKALQAEKLLKCESVPRFIELVEKISNIL